MSQARAVLASDPETAAEAAPLASLAPGDEAVIAALDTSTPEGARLGDLGFLPGTPIRVLRRAPLGDPIEYELRGYRLCLRRSEASRVLVVPAGSAPPS
jgi:Fe2+ transport system protein FeoA